MRVLQSILVVLVVLAVFGSARGEGEGEDIPYPVMIVAGVKKHSEFEELRGMLLNCVGFPFNFALLENLQGVSTTGEYRRLLKGYCDHTLAYNECIVGVKDIATRRLLEKLEAVKINVQGNFMQHVLNVTCEQDGARLLSIIMESYSRPGSPKTYKFLEKCLFKASTAIIDLESSTVSQFNLQQYQILTTFKTCVIDTEVELKEEIEVSIALLNETADTAYCIEETSENEVLCKTIAERKCAADERKLKLGEELYWLYSIKGLDCFMQSENRTQISALLAEANNNVEYKKVADKMCNFIGTKRSTWRCILETKLRAKLCIKGTKVNIFTGMMDLLDIIYRVACREDPYILSEILTAIRKTSFVDDTFIYSCFIFALKKSNGDPKKRRNYKCFDYDPMINFFGCVAVFGARYNQELADSAFYLHQKATKLHSWRKKCPRFSKEYSSLYNPE